MLDTARAVETPEGVTIQLRVAGPVVRSLAWAIDFAIRSGVYIVLAIVSSFFGKFGLGVFLISFFLLEWFYPVLFEVYRDGATPGKRSMGLKVLQDNGVPVGWSASMIRNLLRTADFLPFLYGCGLVSMLLHRDFKRLGDIAAHTVVVYKDSAQLAVNLPEIKPLAPPMRLTSEEQQAIVSFASRVPRLTPERVEELAGTLDDLSPQSRMDVKTLLGYARYIAGHR
ncbi:MAG TPA: RDD family protein [Burkholderiales bacterium]|jgi:uncharacterized RDD family membrane protein YckC|nr:RDD family protein [Burkholderiales bacterium]